MTAIPPSFSRVPTLMASQLMSSNVLSSSRALLDTQLQLASGRAISRPSDDAIGSGALGVLDEMIERREQLGRNLSHADAVLATMDSALGEASELLLEAKGIGFSEIGAGSSADARAAQATVVGALLDQFISLANREYQGIHFFGGEATARPPIEERLNGLAYVGTNGGMATDLGMALPIDITMGGDVVFGAVSGRVQGDHDLDPDLTDATRLSDLNGARGLGVEPGTLLVTVTPAGDDLTVDLSSADTISDVVTLLNDALGAGTAAIDPVNETALQITPPAGVTLDISDDGTGFTAADLGIVGTFAGPAGGVGGDLNARLTPRTELSSLEDAGLGVPLGTIRIENAGQQRDVDLSSAKTIEDVQNAIAALRIGARLEIDAAGDRLDLVNTISGGQLSVGEVGGSTATELGIRSFAGTTALSDFNHGEGVQIISESVDPATGLPDPTRDLDFQVALHDGRTFEVDLAGAETVDDVLTAINDAATTAGVVVPGEFTAGLATTGNGLVLTDGTAGGTDLSVTALNGSFAARDLGLLGTTSSATLAGTDRATVAVDGVFSHLIALRDALLNNDTNGISFATSRLEADIERTASARAEVGGRARRVADAAYRQEDLMIQDESIRSQIRDLDYTKAAVRFSMLQQQLQAGLTTTAQVSSLSLLDFLR